MAGAGRGVPVVVLCGLVMMAGCGEPPVERRAEEVHSEEGRVPEVVLQTAGEMLARVGADPHCAEWLWDREGGDWECTVAGLPYTAELDVGRDGRFAEFEVVVPLEEVRGPAPHIAKMIDETCGEGVEQAVIEFSVRDAALVAAELRLTDVWGHDDVFLEVQCPDGQDFEVDAFGSMITAQDDDVDE
jgi:hypothetical protein